MKFGKAMGVLAFSVLSDGAKEKFFNNQSISETVALDTEVTAGQGVDDCAILSIYTPKEILEYKKKEDGEVDVIEGKLGGKFAYELPNAIVSCKGYITKGEIGDSKVYDNQELHRYAHSDEESKYKAHYHVTGNEKFVRCVAQNLQDTEFKLKQTPQNIIKKAKKSCNNVKWVEKIATEEDRAVCI